MSFRISTDKNKLDLVLIHSFLNNHAPWAIGISVDTVETAIKNSLCFGVFIDELQIGFARLITDQATFGYLCDVFILPAHRSNGYGKQLIQHIFAMPQLKRLRRIVLVTADAHELYRLAGFESLAQPERYMEIHRPQIYQQSPKH
ncbi:GNAT family N-acetyltransferase [Aquirhabdus parva]|uniref:N-acetyltransferase n=1 Tax=Aquirhabdus parva TaxID=2283318 RepID=A0A345P7A5_9GAMM|nr:GNAT family N-acetyltransferase [Aquirhabdus parva]AXI03164.1 N-acetyltransferase [Aquirhabdus parva]